MVVQLDTRLLLHRYRLNLTRRRRRCCRCSFRPRLPLLLLILVPKLTNILVTQELPPILAHMEQVVRVPRIRIPMPGRNDRTPAQLLRIFITQVPVVPLIENTVRKRRTGSDGEDVPLESGSIVIDVEDGGARLVPSADHGAHG